ncbi:hypothetical protein BDW22DRAFT_1320152 [Trametopsis cervina]|nr:hypothetical protein BDW22DRAFT_1320152 [Trametopsis cervina]
MAGIARLWLLAALLAAFCSVAVGDDTNDPCTVRDGDIVYDLNPLKSKTDYKLKSPDGHEFSINVCQGVRGETWAFEAHINPEQVGGYTRRDHGDFSLGNFNTTLTVRDGNPTLTMSKGSPCPTHHHMHAATTVQFKCDNSVGTGEPVLIAQLPPPEDSSCYFFIEWRTNVACPSYMRTTAWSVVGILASTIGGLFVLYIILGTLYNFVVLDHRGLDAIPRYSLVSLQDTVTFIRRCYARFADRPSGGSFYGSRRANMNSGYRGLGGTGDEEEGMLSGPPGFLDEQDEDEEEPVSAHGPSKSMDFAQTSMNDDQNYVAQGYAAYASDEDGYSMPYQQPPGMVNYPMQPAMAYQPSLNMLPQGYPNPVFNASQPHGRMPLPGSPPPHSPALYDSLSPPVSGSDTSDGVYHRRSQNSSSTGSPSSSRGNSLVHRHPLRYNPTPSPTSSDGRRSRGRSLSDDDEGMGAGLAENLANTRKEATRRQRIEAEQRRRDELRDGYARLKDVLPISNQKSSKVSLLERATNHIVSMEKNNRQLQARLEQLELEIRRLRSLNEKISLTTVADKSPSPSGHGNMESGLLYPPSEGSQLTSVGGQDPPHDDSNPPSPSDGAY